MADGNAPRRFCRRCGAVAVFGRDQFCPDCRDERRKETNRAAQAASRANRRAKQAANRAGQQPPVTLTAAQVTQVKAALHDLTHAVTQAARHDQSGTDPRLIVDYLLPRVAEAQRKLADLLAETR